MRTSQRVGGVSACTVAMVIAAGCATSSSAPTAAEESIRFEDTAYRPEDVSISLARSECYGDCPVYRVVVHGTGEVVFTGEKFVARAGEHRWRISPELVERLFYFADGTHFMSMEDVYQRQVSDVSEKVITVKAGARSKSLTNRWSPTLDAMDPSPLASGHATLDCLAFAIDVIAGTRPYVRGEPQPNE